MPFIGNQPADKFLTLEKQVFTTSATDTYTLDREVSSVNDLELFLNNVRQEPTEAYTISGTTLTLASAITSSDSMYCVYQGRAVGTTKPADNTVTGDMMSYPLTNFSSTGIDDNASSTAVTIDSSGNVGIGETSMDGLLVVKGDSDSSSTPSIRLKDGTDSREAFITNSSGDLIIATTNSSDDVIDSAITIFTQSMILKTNGTNRMLIQSNGDIFFSNTTESAINGGSTDGKFIDNGDGARLRSSRASTSTREHIIFYNPNGDVGDISTSGTSTSYNTSSDYRLKENVVDITGATERLKQLQPKRFNFIADADTTVDGFLAHEVSSIVPEAISGEKDAMRTEEYEVTPAELDEEGNIITEAVMGTREVPDYQGIDQSKLVPLLTASLKEAIAKIEELETRIATLEGN